FPHHPTTSPSPYTTLFRSARCGREVITLSSPDRAQVRQEDGDEERGHQMHPANAQRDRDEADERCEARQPDADGTGRRGQEEERSEEHTSELQSPDHLVCR